MIEFHFTPYMAWATATFIILSVGRYVARRHHAWHPRLMISGVLSDLTLVLVLQFQRHAIQTVADHKLSSIQMAHVGAATLALLIYFPALFMGYRVHNTLDHQKKLVLKKTHVRLGNLAYTLRAISFVLMFSMGKPLN